MLSSSELLSWVAPISVQQNACGWVLRLLDQSTTSWYWLGVLLADGSFPDGRLVFSQSDKDANQVLKLAAYIGLDASRIASYDTTTNFGSSCGKRISFRRVDAVADIKNLLLIKDSSKTASPPDMQQYKLMHDQWLSLIVGLIDGDGSVRLSARTNPKGTIQLRLHSSWNLNLQLLTNLLYRAVGCSYGPEVVAGQHASVSWNRSAVIDLLNNHVVAHNLPVSSRKWRCRAHLPR